jgi:hypothetical protein
MTVVGALGGLLAAAGRDLESTYLAGVTGHGFRLTLDLVVSPSGPTEFNFHEVLPQWERLGAWFKRVAVKPGDEGFEAGRASILSRIRESIDAGLPVIAYDLLRLPEYGLVIGYDGDRLGCLTLENPVEPGWMDSADWPPHEHRSFSRVEAITLLDIDSGFDRRKAEVASIRDAVEHFWAPAARDMWLQHGKQAYQFWGSLLRSPLALHGLNPGLGHSYNLLVLHRARCDAAAYLHTLSEQYREAPSLGEAAALYEQVVQALEGALEILPFPGGERLADPTVRLQLADCLHRALLAEEQGITRLERAVRVLR